MIYDAGIEKKVNELLKELDDRPFEEAVSILNEAYNTVMKAPYEREYDVAVAKAKFQVTYLKKIIDSYHKKCKELEVPSISTEQIQRIEKIYRKANEIQIKDKECYIELLDCAGTAKEVLYCDSSHSVKRIIDLYGLVVEEMNIAIDTLKEENKNLKFEQKNLEEDIEKLEQTKEKIVNELNN